MCNWINQIIFLLQKAWRGITPALNTWAIPCDNVVECKKGKDEIGCSFPSYYLFVSILGLYSFIIFSLFCVLKYSLSKNEKKCGNWNENVDENSKKENDCLHSLTLTLQQRRGDHAVLLMYNTELEKNQQNESKTICSLKVIYF